MKVRTPHYFAPIRLMAGGVWGSGDSPDKAVKNACREAVGFLKALGMGVGKKDTGTTMTVPVYSIRPDCYAYTDHHGRTFEVSRDTDEIVAYAEIAFLYHVDDPRKPLSTSRLGDVRDAYIDGGKAVRDANARRAEPIGSKVA
jgi:hypothetical protein